MQEPHHEPYQQPPPTAEQQAQELERRKAMQAEQELELRQAEQQQAMPAEQQPAQQQMPTRELERQAEERETFLTPDQREQYRSRWNDIQIEFVTNPRKSAEGADRLVGEMVQTLGKQLTDQCSKLEQESKRDNTSTEDLRVALGHYRSFFDRLLSI